MNIRLIKLNNNGEQMLKSNLMFMGIIMNVLLSGSNYGQLNLNGLLVEGGIMRNLTPSYFDESKLAFYSELGLQGSFFNPNIEWVMSFSYFDDGIDDEFSNTKNLPTYSNSSTILEVYLKFHPRLVWKKSRSPIRINLGISWHYTKSKYVGSGFDIPTILDAEFNQSVFNVDTGIDLVLEISYNIELYTQAMLLVPLSEYKYHQEGFLRYQMGVGAHYKF
jgi:hypothetical protein